jgi:hypothetical protein
MLMYLGLFPINNIEVLCASNGMRESKNISIMYLIEECTVLKLKRNLLESEMLLMG